MIDSMMIYHTTELSIDLKIIIYILHYHLTFYLLSYTLYNSLVYILLSVYTSQYFNLNKYYLPNTNALSVVYQNNKKCHDHQALFL